MSNNPFFTPVAYAAGRWAEGSGMLFPATLGDPFAFHLTLTAPQRLNKGEQAKTPSASLTIGGTAVPMPRWVMY